MMRSRWAKRLAIGCLALAAASGCTKQVLLEPADVDRAMANVPPRLETHPQDPITPMTKLDPTQGPATVLDPDRRPVNMSLQECFVTALKQGNIGSQGGLNNPGFTNDSPGQFGGRQFAGGDNIAVVAFDPSISYLDVERSLSKFDARWISSMTWSKQDSPVASQFLQFQSQQDQAQWTSTIAKPLPTGGVAGITTSINYSKFSNVPTNLGTFVNPNYTPRVQFQFEQPLWQMFGVQINQIASSHPGSLLIPGLRSTGQGTEGILIARIRYDQQRAEFDRLINQQLLNVESAYWDLYAAYYNLYAQEEVLKRSTYLLDVVKKRWLVAGSLRPQQYYQTLQQYQSFKAQVLQARQTILTTEARLRGLMGMRSDDGTRIVPTDTPQISELVPNAYEAQMDAIAFRPELIQARHEIKAQQLNLMLQKNLRRPDFRLLSSYDIAGLGTALDGGDNQNAFHSLRENRFNSWSVGVRGDMAIGFRDANALVRQANENLYRTYFIVHDGERKAVEAVNTAIRNLAFNAETAKVTRASREAAQQTVELNYKVLESGQWDVQFLNQLLIDQQNFARSVSDEFRLIAEYAKSLAGLEWARGTIQRYNNVTIAEGELPDHVKKKAVDHIRARDAALKLREHPAEFALPPLHDYTPIPKPAEMSFPIPPPETKPGAEKLPTPLPLPGGAVPAPGKISQWPGDAPATPVRPFNAPPAVTPATSTAPPPASPAPVPVTTISNGTLVPADDATFKPAGTLKFEKNAMSPFPTPTGGK
jgi:outer membrane protein TolC